MAENMTVNEAAENAAAEKVVTKRGQVRRAGIRPVFLAAAALAVALGLGLSWGFGTAVPAGDYGVKLEAARRMAACMERIRAYKEERGIALPPEDIHKTGLIGEPMTGITTTLGALEAKRTAADPNMAALAAELFTQAGLKPGDRVAAGFSGSFPGLNLAVICACDAMGLELIYISSVGASTYGANQPELTFPDMAWLLAGDGLISGPGAANTPGGEKDCGLDMDAQALAAVIRRLETYSVPLPVIQDYEENLARRRQIYEAGGPADCFAGVGGNITTLGLGAEQFPWGLSPGVVAAADETAGGEGAADETEADEAAGRGLLAYYNGLGLPVLNLINIRQLTAEYGLPYDPESPDPPGTGPLYHEKRGLFLPALAGLAAAPAILIYGRLAGGKPLPRRKGGGYKKTTAMKRATAWEERQR